MVAMEEQTGSGDDCLLPQELNTLNKSMACYWKEEKNEAASEEKKREEE